MNPEQLVEKISDQHKVPEGDVQEIYENKLEECEEAGLKGDQAVERAMKRTFNEFKRRSMSSSTGVEGVILGAGDRYDAVNYSREQAIEAYQENPQKAIKENKVALAVPPDETGNITGNGVEVVGEKNGWSIVAHPDNSNIMGYNFAERGSAETDDANTDVEDGWRVYPLDNRTFDDGTNDNFGMPTDKHQYKRRGMGVFRIGDSEDVVLGHLILTGKNSAQHPPLGKAVQFQARTNEGDDGEIYIYSTNDTEFEPNPELQEKMSSPDALIERHMSDYLHDLDSLYSHLADKQGNQTVVATGDVVTLDLEGSSNNTLRMVIAEFSFAGGEMQDLEATVWIPEWQKQYIDFAVESEVYVIGRARLQDAYDPVEGERTSEEQEVVINAQGVYADPTSKIPRDDDADELEEEDLEFDAELDDEEGLEGDDSW